MTKKVLICASLFIFICFMSIGYSALNTELTISGDVAVNPPNQILINSVVVKEFVDGAYERYSSSFTINSTQMHVTLPNSTSQVVYEITLNNQTANNYLLNNIEEIMASNPNVVWDIRNITYSTKLGHGNTKFELVISNKYPTLTNQEISLDLNYHFILYDNYKDTTLAGADPVLTTNLIPVIINADGTVLKADTSTAWYNYNNKQWANAVMIIDKSNRDLYISSPGGTIIDSTHIAAYYVWIPRYEYQIWDEVQTNFTWGEDKNEMQEINIRFVDNNIFKKETTGVGDWFTHPAFSYFDGSTTMELNGFWVNKFELTGTSAAPTSLPLSAPLRNLNLANYFNVISSFKNIYMDGNSKVDTHLIKNSEWAAVAYLSSSMYGKNSEVILNNYSKQITGCGADISNLKSVSTCLNAFGTINSDVYNSSTSGNISGVFDMSGGLWERTMGIQLNSSGIIDFSSSGFTDLNPKYYDIYKYSSSGHHYINSGYGQAISENAGWYNDYSSIPNGATNHWTLRSGDQGGGTSSGIFGFMTSTGVSYWTHATRGTMWVYE